MFDTYFTAKFIIATGALICIVLSRRSDGKTFDCKVRALNDYKDKRHITVYMRRWKTEITELMYSTFFDDVICKPKYKEFALWDFRGSKKGVKVKLPNEKEFDWIVLFCPLSMSAKLKSQIDVFINRIFIIDYDEFIPLDGRYIKDEAKLLLEFWKSIDRDRDIVQLVVLGNKITPFNPLFDFFGIEAQITNEKMRLFRDGTIALQVYVNQEHKNAVSKSRFGKMIKDTEYDDYDAGGLLYALNLKIGNIKGAEYYCSFLTQKGEGSIYIKDSNFIVSKSKRKDGFLLTDRSYNVNRTCFMITYGMFTRIFKEAYRSNRILFEDEKAYHIFEDIMKKIC